MFFRYGGLKRLEIGVKHVTKPPNHNIEDLSVFRKVSILIYNAEWEYTPQLLFEKLTKTQKTQIRNFGAWPNKWESHKNYEMEFHIFVVLGNVLRFYSKHFWRQFGVGLSSLWRPQVWDNSWITYFGRRGGGGTAPPSPQNHRTPLAFS